ncbi:MAG TPA: right-handed parallel beta-helix repeat-containing protein, partial [Armatimonadota bacterium]
MRRPYLLYLVASLLFAVSPAWAEVVYVDQAAPGTVHDGASWSTAYLTVTGGVAAAASGDEVWVSRGFYTEAPISPGAGVALYGGFTGGETQRGQRNFRANAAVLSGSDGEGVIVTCQYPNIVLDGFTLQNGGPSVDVTSGAATIANNTIYDNGVGVLIESGAADILGNNIAANRAGVAIMSGTATLANNTIADNGEMGVCILGQATLTNNTISANGEDGVGVYSSTATLANNVLAFNGNCGFHVESGASIP